jgi:hypothetical protein
VSKSDSQRVVLDLLLPSCPSRPVFRSYALSPAPVHLTPLQHPSPLPACPLRPFLHPHATSHQKLVRGSPCTSSASFGGAGRLDGRVRCLGCREKQSKPHKMSREMGGEKEGGRSEELVSKGRGARSCFAPLRTAWDYQTRSFSSVAALDRSGTREDDGQERFSFLDGTKRTK